MLLRTEQFAPEGSNGYENSPRSAIFNWKFSLRSEVQILGSTNGAISSQSNSNTTTNINDNSIY